MKLYPNITTIFIIWAVSIFIIFYFAFLLFPHSGKFSNNFLENLSNWDGNYYIGIAKEGYTKRFLYAFFPTFPIFIRLVTLLTQNYLLSAVLISMISSFFGLQILYKIISLDFDKRLANKVISALLFFPTSFYFLTSYSEGLFFLFVILSFYFLRQNKLFMAVSFASLASATRLAGLAVALALLVDVQFRFGINRKNWFVILAPLGFFAYCFYLYQRVSDPLYFITAEKYWMRILSLPGLSFWETLKNLTTANFINLYPYVFLDFIFAIFGLGLALRSFRFLPQAFSFYALISITLPIATSSLTSMPRFLLVIFPIFILIALLKNKYVIFAYQTISLILLALFAALFINGYWVG